MLCYQVGNNLTAFLLIYVCIVFQPGLPAMSHVPINFLHGLGVVNFSGESCLHPFSVLSRVEAVVDVQSAPKVTVHVLQGFVVGFDLFIQKRVEKKVLWCVSFSVHSQFQGNVLIENIFSE